MMFLWRSCRRNAVLSAKTMYSQAAVSEPAVDRILDLDFPALLHRDSPWSHRQRNPWTHQALLQDIGTPEVKNLSSITTEHATLNRCVQRKQENYSSLVANSPHSLTSGQYSPDVRSVVLEGIHSPVSLYGCMQTNVPQPHHTWEGTSSMGYSSHHNQPGYSKRLQDKYIGGALHEYHPSRHFATSSTHSNINRLSPNISVNTASRDCTQQLGSGRGRKTLEDIFDEQDQLIHRIVKDFQQKRSYSTSSKSEVGSSDSSSGTPSQDGNTSSPDSTPSSDGKNNLSQKDKLKRAVKEYGGTVFVFYFGLSALSLCSCYIAVSSGLDVRGFLAQIGVGAKILDSLSTSYGDFTTLIVAYALHKVFFPARVGLTLTCSPLLVRHLRKIGFIKPPATSSPPGNKGTTK